MIIFYDQTGQIVGTVEGRIHPPEHLKMWVGDREKTERVIVEWEPSQYFDQKGNKVEKSKLEKDKTYNVEFEPNCAQKELFREIDKNPSLLYEYKFDIKKKEFIPKNTKGNV